MVIIFREKYVVAALAVATCVMNHTVTILSNVISRSWNFETEKVDSTHDK